MTRVVARRLPSGGTARPTLLNACTGTTWIRLPEPGTATTFIDATFLDKKGNILGAASCSGSETKPRQVTTLSGYSRDAVDFDWATIEYQNSF